ncbi:orotidine-5'-phosphate decarboxylase [Paenisporosarcina cavernae]|uniref:Orotidine 5'-phosphate decarboxylase n=1 Tax=Paenisporosarcina cavernae TaxID=2320858 RepID=A0A385YRG3_9BACL|nr:orotidine-5'-phosphate decarboxylase [Paenisporosarcina cavernae]AYC29186.1 orotidine-5'-phosphate decarboxylase [Paenisporosarcina cavernae]
MTRPIIVALDFATKEEAVQFLHSFSEPLFVKVGMELYYQEGPSVVRKLKALGHAVFLDLKLHDIPNTVYSAMKGLAKLGVDMVNVHAAGGIEMMQAAKRGLEDGLAEGSELPKLIAVTQLTSSSEELVRSEQKSELSLRDSVLHYAKLAQTAGLDGVVCSSLEADMLRENIGDDFLLVTPGIRLTEGNHHDQKRVATPNLAKQLGSSYIVVGRTITQDKNPVAAYRSVQNDWERD